MIYIYIEILYLYVPIRRGLRRLVALLRLADQRSRAAGVHRAGLRPRHCGASVKPVKPATATEETLQKEEKTLAKWVEIMESLDVHIFSWGK